MDQRANERVQALIDEQVADGRQIGIQVAAYRGGNRSSTWWPEPWVPTTTVPCSPTR